MEINIASSCRYTKPKVVFFYMIHLRAYIFVILIMLGFGAASFSSSSSAGEPLSGPYKAELLRIIDGDTARVRFMCG